MESIPTIRKENGDKMNTNEIRKTQVASFGATHEPMDKESVNIYRLQCRNYLEQAFENYLENPSASNWSTMIPAMMWHQYWMQKAIYDEVEE